MDTEHAARARRDLPRATEQGVAQAVPALDREARQDRMDRAAPRVEECRLGSLVEPLLQELVGLAAGLDTGRSGAFEDRAPLGVVEGLVGPGDEDQRNEVQCGDLAAADAGAFEGLGDLDADRIAQPSMSSASSTAASSRRPRASGSALRSACPAKRPPITSPRLRSIRAATRG